jgi:tetratricopeptide (TPR) repeat protein
LDPGRAEDIAAFIGMLRELVAEAGAPSYRELAKRVGPLLKPPQVVAHTTISDLLKPDRRRLNLDLVVAVVRALGEDEPSVDRWRQAAIRVHAAAKAGGSVAVLRQLPRDLPTFTGRTAALRELLDAVGADHLDGPRTVVVSAIEGMAGVGKTRLAVHAAHELVRGGRFADIQLYADLRGFDPELPPAEPAEVLERFLLSVGVPGQKIPATVPERSAMLRDRLFDQDALVLLDNAADEEQVRELIPAGRRCLVIVTSRRTLAGLDGASVQRLDVFTRAEALELLARIAGAARIEADPEAADRLIAACGALPLALAVAASRLRARPAWTIADLVSRFEDDGLNALSVGGRSVRRVFELSYNELAPELRELFGLLGCLFTQTIAVPVAAAATGLSLAETEDLLERLFDEHLVQSLSAQRYAMHDLLRAYAAERGERDVPEKTRKAAASRLAVWYARCMRSVYEIISTHSIQPLIQNDAFEAGAAPMRFEDHAAAIAWLSAERSSIVHAVLQAEAAGAHREAEVLARSGSYLLLDRDYWDEYTALHEARIRIARLEGTEDIQAEAQNCVSRGYMELERFAEALEAAEHAAAYYERTGWVRMQAATVESIALTHMLQGDNERALPAMERALTLRRADTDFPWGLAATLNNLAELHLRFDHAESVVALHQEAIAITQAGGMTPATAVVTKSYGASLLELRRYESAIEVLSDAAERYAALGDPSGEASATSMLAEAYEEIGEIERATSCREHAKRLLAED